MIRAILIDAKAREVRAIELPDEGVARVAVMNAAIGGYFQVGYMWSSGDVLYVDEDGIRHDWPHGFVFLPGPAVGFPRPLLGNGVIVGREVEVRGGDDWTHLDPAISVDEVRRLVRFIER